MPKLTKAQQKFATEYGLPVNAREIDMDACTCGAHGCNEHETWSAKVLNQVFAGWEPSASAIEWIEGLFSEKVEK